MDVVTTICIVGVCVVIVSIAYFLFSLSRRKSICGIPKIKPNSFFGYTKFIIHKFDNHRNLLTAADRYGPIIQYNLFGNLRVCINDMKLAKIILRDLKNKSISLKPDRTNRVRK